MSLPLVVRKRVREYLAPGEELRYLFPANLVTTGFSSMMAPMLVAVTDRSVVILACKWFRRHRPSGIYQRFARTTQIGPVDTKLTPTIELGRMVLEVHEDYVAVICAADAELDGGELPPDPLPDL